MLKLILQLISECLMLEKPENRRIPAIIRYPLFTLMLFLVSVFTIGSFWYGIKIFEENNILGLLSIIFGVAIIIFVICIFGAAFKKVTPISKKEPGRDFEIISKDTPVGEVSSSTTKKSNGVIGKIGLVMFIVTLILIVILVATYYL